MKRITLIASAIVLLIRLGSVAAGEKPLVVELWPGKAPEEPGTIGAEYVRPSPKLDRKQVEVTESTKLVTNVTKPTITIYHPPLKKGGPGGVDSRPAVL